MHVHVCNITCSVLFYVGLYVVAVVCICFIGVIIAGLICACPRRPSGKRIKPPNIELTKVILIIKVTIAMWCLDFMD